MNQLFHDLATDLEKERAEERAPKELLSLVGTKHCSAAAHTFVATMRTGEPLVLVREPRNRYDRFAIRVENEAGTKIGYIAAAENMKLAKAMDQAGRERQPAKAAIGERGGIKLEVLP